MRLPSALGDNAPRLDRYGLDLPRRAPVPAAANGTPEQALKETRIHAAHYPRGQAGQQLDQALDFRAGDRSGHGGEHSCEGQPQM